MSDQVFYLTTPIYYVNDVPHLGTSYTTIAADLICRWQRLLGRDVHFLTGTDEHGQKLDRAAASKGLAAKEYVDSMVPSFIDAWKLLDISYDDFIRTTEPRHETRAQKFVQALHDKGDIYLDTYKGLYCVGCEAFKQPDELVDGKCPDHGTEPEEIEESNYFFRLSKYQDKLIELYTSNPRFVMPEGRRNEVLGKVRKGLDDLSMSRVSFEWGIPVPWDPDHVIYVWFEALQNYITAVGYGEDEDTLARIWPADVHLVGKDIVWFHAVIWPAMLMALDLPLPRTIYAHGWLLVGGKKMSKSNATKIHPSELTDVFGVDGFRYYLMREISFGQDGEFSWESLHSRYNSDLANDLGNLASRVLSMVGRYLDGVVPDAPNESEVTPEDRALMEVFHEAVRKATEAMDNYALREAIESLWSFVRKSNSYVEETAPWKLAKDETQSRRLEVVLYMLVDSLRLIAITLSPLMPSSSANLWSRLGLDRGLEGRTLPEEGGWGTLVSGARVEVGQALFPRLDD